jgi:hypothetical protein
MKTLLTAGLMLVLSTAFGLAGDNPFLGTWKLKSFVWVVTDTNERVNAMGDHPTGYLGYSADGRMYAIIAANGRVKPSGFTPSNEQRAELERTFLSYAGTYTYESDRLIHHIDISWNETWTGVDQVRFFNLDGNTLTLKTPPIKGAADGRDASGIVVWERLKAATP